ncbi:MAG: hypothetical protein ABIK44_00170 [candidate division WOR-3 bacterium]
MTDGVMRSGSPRADTLEPFVPELTALSFSTIRSLLCAGQLLRENGIDVIVAPRRVAGCGAVLVLDTSQLAPALTILARQNIKPDTVSTYLPEGGIHE